MSGIGPPDPFNPSGGEGGDPWGKRVPATSSVKKSSSYGLPYPVAYGTCAVKGIPLWVYDKGDLKFLPDGAYGGENVGRAAEVQYAFSYGPIQGFDSLIHAKRLYGPQGSIDHDYVGATNPPSGSSKPDFFLGDGTTTEWTHYSGGGWETRIPWPMLALMRCRYFWVPDGAGTIPEVKGVLAGRFATHANDKRKLVGETWTRLDALPGDVVRDLIENATYGLGMPTGTVVTAAGSDGNAASSYDRYCTANGWFIALAIDQEVSVEEVVSQILQATNSVGVWSEGHFKVFPLGDAAVGTYTPVLTAYAITDDDIVMGSGDPIKSRRRAWSDCYNVIPVEYSADTKLHDAELAVTESLDVANAVDYGVRRGKTISLPCIRSAIHAQNLSGILARRSCYNRTTFEFTLSPRHGALLECADLVAITCTVMGLSNQIARIEEIEEDAEGNYLVRACEWLVGAGVTVETSPQTSDGYHIDPVPDRDNYGIGKSKNTTTYSATAPSNPGIGDQWYDTDDGNKLYVWSGSAWVQGPVGPTGPAGPTGGTGLSGSTGARGPGVFSASAGYASKADIDPTYLAVSCYAAQHAVTGGDSVFGDQVTLYSTIYTTPWSATYFCTAGGNYGTWVAATVVIDGNLLVTGTVGANKLAANSIVTSDYAEDGNGNPTAGAKMFNNSSGTPLKVAPSGIKIGSTLMSESWLNSGRMAGALISSNGSTITLNVGIGLAAYTPTIVDGNLYLRLNGAPSVPFVCHAIGMMKNSTPNVPISGFPTSTNTTDANGGITLTFYNSAGTAYNLSTSAPWAVYLLIVAGKSSF